MTLQHAQEISDIGSIETLTKQLLLMMTSQGVGKTSSPRRLKWLEIISIAERRALSLGGSRFHVPSLESVPITHQVERVDTDPGLQAPPTIG